MTEAEKKLFINDFLDSHPENVSIDVKYNELNYIDSIQVNSGVYFWVIHKDNIELLTDIFKVLKQLIDTRFEADE